MCGWERDYILSSVKGVFKIPEQSTINQYFGRVMQMAKSLNTGMTVETLGVTLPHAPQQESSLPCPHLAVSSFIKPYEVVWKYFNLLWHAAVHQSTPEDLHREVKSAHPAPVTTPSLCLLTSDLIKVRLFINLEKIRGLCMGFISVYLPIT